jgi:glycosyltransferase involved in cell wall biosynthesis
MIAVASSTIAVVVPYRFVPPLNGGHKAAFGLCAFLSQECPVIAISTSGNTEAPFPIEPLLPGSVLRYISPRAAWRIWQCFRRERPRYCLAHQPFIALLLLPICFHLGIPLGIYVQNLEYQRFRSLGRWWWPVVLGLEWVVFRLARHLHFISPDEVQPARQVFSLPSGKCSVLPYGTPYAQQPPGREEARRRIRQHHGYGETECLIIFFGPQTYQPNLEAAERIISYIEPALKQLAPNLDYRFIICGGGLPTRYQGLKNYERIEYLGYVQDIEAYVQASDLMINPVNSGGGVKTKLVEALALGTTVVSSRTGALGVWPEACGDKLIQVEDEDYQGFARALLNAYPKHNQPTPGVFYEHYYWGAIIKKALAEAF